MKYLSKAPVTQIPAGTVEGGRDSSELRPGFQGKMRILHIYASLMLFPQAIRTKLRVQVDDGHRYVTGL